MFYSKELGVFFLHRDGAPADTVEITREEHAVLMAGHYAGKRIVPDENGYPALMDPAPPALTDAIEKKRADIERWRDEQEQAAIVFAHAGHEWDGGLKVRARLQPVLALIELPDGFYWTDAANEDVPMTLTSVYELNAAHETAIVVRGFHIHARQRQMKTEIDALTSVEAVLAYAVA